MYSHLRERPRSEGGFTLIELLVVMIIIAILMAVAVPTFLAQKNSAQKSKATANIKQIVNAIESCNNSATTGSGYDVTRCLTPTGATGLQTFEKGLTSLAIGTTAATAATPYGIVPAAGTPPQGYAVSAYIMDGSVPVIFTEVHGADGTLIKGCGSAALTPETATAPTVGVANSKTCPTGTW